ncbi:pantoate--beta-alanine ligase [Aeromicrobium stalagmiti]|uniref:pantoate--beta-alanine ligase n=1 Tax=Aeromicrobium stalagmiti TaxID=2738988 RepID=UPI00156A0271|nr:pantoate--beta-alanine ligase [Aeromicrobium stalagmiti]NRQ48580.1 pantoate--beta-alanine ligase [Aeromicrobium stalagmiti]
MTTPVIARTRAELAQARGGDTVAFVPTMGALHDGHVQLLKHARPLGQTLVASIFVNPTQFAPGEDFEDYPRTFEADLERCAEAGVDVVFAPAVPTMYPSGLVDTVTVDPGPLGTILEGASRPTHFRGVLTVVSKLFGLVRPDVAVFGEKDYQQLTLVTQMARELALGVEVVGCPTVRETDGLAMSSRNRYLTADERQTAAALSAALRAGVAAAAHGPDAVLAAAHAVIDPADVDLDYLVLTDPELGPAVPGEDARLLVAARVGKPRLLDNIGLTLGGLATGRNLP